MNLKHSCIIVAILASAAAGCLHRVETANLPVAAESPAAPAATIPGALAEPGAGVVFDNAPGHAAVAGAAIWASGGQPGESWRLTDWRGGDTGIDGAFDSDGRAMLPPLAPGYYRLVAGEQPAPRQLAALAIVPPPRAADGARPDNSPFAIDTALSWIAKPGTFACPWNNGDTFATVADLIRLAGFRHVRERLSWKAVQPSPDTPPAWGRYLDNASLFWTNGMAVSGMFHDAPAWAGTAAPRESLPSDLGAVHDFCRAAAAAFGDRMEDWEFWNEEDIHFCKEPAWEYVAAMKAAYLGFKAARPGMPVLNGALCQVPRSTRYNAVFLQNDAARYFDVFNYHTYIRLSKYPEVFADLRGQLRAGGAAGKPIWLTEFGTNAEGHSARDGAKEGMKAHSPAQELVHAETYPKSQIALMMEGVARAYWFVFPAFNERSGFKDWGVMRRDGTVKPIYAAIATAIRELDGAALLGALDTPVGIRAYLFGRPDGTQTVAFWSESPIDTSANGEIAATPDYAREFALVLPAGHGGAGIPGNQKFSLVDMCGAASAAPLATDGSLPLRATRFPAYLSGLRGLAAARPPIPGATTPGAAATSPDLSGTDLTIVLHPSLNNDDFAISGGKSIGVMKNDSGRLSLDVWNLSDTAKTGTVSIAGAVAEGLPEGPFAIGPFGRRTFQCLLAPSSDADMADVVISGTFNGRATTRAVVPVFFEKRFLANCSRHPVAWRDPARWERNTSADEETISFDEAEQALRIDSSWRNLIDHWTYPVLTLDLPAESLDGAIRISFEARSAQDKVENDFKTAKFMLVGENGTPDTYIDYTPPGTEWERRFVDIPAGTDLASVRKIRLGANPYGSRSTIWFRNIEILK